MVRIIMSCSGPVLVNRAEPECRIAGMVVWAVQGAKAHRGASRAQRGAGEGAGR